LYPQAFKVGTSIGILFHLEVTHEIIRNWTSNYGLEMTKVGVSTDSILNNKKEEFENLADNCKVVYSNFFKMITKRN
jgi:GMP synthase (glutamine-hydrolysing)